jgi:hypothetical protein
MQPTGNAASRPVIIDEASMLTEDQLAATLDAIETTAVERLILVGDPRQLPPIGVGRPFVDIVRFLKDSVAATSSSKPYAYAELKIVRRQTEQGAPATDAKVARDDIVLSRWFAGEAADPGADEVWDRLVAGKAVGVRALKWESDADLQVNLLDEIKAAVRSIAQRGGFDHERDEALFKISLGAGHSMARSISIYRVARRVLTEPNCGEEAERTSRLGRYSRPHVRVRQASTV